MPSRFDIALEESLEAVEHNVPIEEILARYPEYREALAPILESTRLLGDLHERPSIEARRQSREAFVGAGQDAAAAGMLAFDRPRFRFSPLQAAAGIIVVLGLGAVMVLSGRQPAEPRLAGLESWLAGLPYAIMPLIPPDTTPIIEDPVEELPPPSLNALVGVVEAIWSDGTLIVEGVEVLVGPETVIEGDVQIGVRVVVEGQTEGQRMLATVIRVIEEAEDVTAEVTPPPVVTQEVTVPPPVVTEEPSETPDVGGGSGGDDTPEPDETDEPGDDDTPEPVETDEPDEPEEPDDD